MALAPLDPDRSSCGDRISSSAPALAAFEACGSGAFGSTAVWIHWPLATGFPLAAHRTHWLPTGPTGSTAHWPAVGAGWLVGASAISAPGEVASEIAGARRAARRSLFSSLGGRQVGRAPSWAPPREDRRVALAVRPLLVPNAAWCPAGECSFFVAVQHRIECTCTQPRIIVLFLRLFPRAALMIANRRDP